VADISPGIFREYDIRGRAGTELTSGTARLIARAFAGWLEERLPAAAPRRMVLGRDNRHSSPELAAGIARGFRESGWEVTDLGVVPTPVFYFARVRYGLDPGVMVTGSHNEAAYNGFKLAFGPGTLYGEDIREIGCRAAALEEGRTAGPEAVEAGVPEAIEADHRLDPLPDYAADIRERVRLAPRGRPLRVAVDCGSGAASVVAPALYGDLGCEIVPLWCELDADFPGHWPDPVKPENLSELRRVVRERRADVGLAFDGDADRLGVVDDTGEILWGDVLMILFWREILPRHPGARAIIEVKCSQALVDEVRRLGGDPLFYRTGHSLIKAKMRELGALFAGEMSGHLFFADEYYGFDDAIYAGARLLRILASADEPLSTLLADRPRYFSTPEIRVDCPDETKFDVVDKVREDFTRAGREVITVDGARVLFPEGWVLVRASNTQPALVVRCEATTEEGLERLKGEVSSVLGRLREESGLEMPDL
jgi:phosphomannomutase/phosphoglucomutase